MNRWIPVGLGLAAIWGAATAVTWVARSAAPDPESVARYVAENRLDLVPEAKRPGVLEGAARRLNRLDFEQRRTLRADPAFREFFESMTEAEQVRFLDLTLPEGFRQMMMALNKMDADERKRLVERALADLEAADAGGGDLRGPGGRSPDDEQAQKIIREGMSAFYEDANADVKLDFAPVIERIQQLLQSRR